MANTNPYTQNPFATQGTPWSFWQQPQNENDRGYYDTHQREAFQQFQNAWGAPNGNLQKFFDSNFGQVYADYVKQTEQANNPGKELHFTDTLTQQLGDHLQKMWQGQTAYQRGENYAPLSAGRRV